MFIRFDMIHERKKNRRFHVQQPTFLFPLETHGAPPTITKYVAWTERQFNACQTTRSMYLSIFNVSELCLSQCVSPKIASRNHIIVLFATFKTIVRVITTACACLMRHKTIVRVITTACACLMRHKLSK